jgi:O-antigen/teichoic acid export membrane protein
MRRDPDSLVWSPRRVQAPSGADAVSSSRGIAITTLGNVIPPFAALVTQPILAHGLGLFGRGEVAAATAPLMFGVAVLTLGLPESLTYSIARRTAGLRGAMRLSLGLLVLAGLAGSLIIASLAALLSAGDTALAQLMIVAGCALAPALAVAGLRGLAAGRQMWTLIALERVVGALLQLAFVVVLFASGTLTVLLATTAIALTTFLGGIAYVLALGRVPDNPAGAPEGDRPRVLHYAGRVWLGTLTGMLLSRLDQLLITPLAGVSQLGLYAVAVSITDVILVFNSAVRDVMFAVESRSPDPSRLGSASRVSTLITLGLGLALAAACPWAIPFLFGRDFEDAVVVTLILIMAIVLGNPGSVAGAGLSARGRPGLRSLSLGIAAAANVVAIVVLVPSYGAIGAAVATLIGNVVAGNAVIIWLRVVFGVPLSEFYRFRTSDLSDVIAQASQLVQRNSSRGRPEPSHEVSDHDQ